jgi:hypothetical protein
VTFFPFAAGLAVSRGTATLVAGTATVAAPQVTASSVIQVTPQPGTAPLALPWVSAKTPGTGFVVTSLNVADVAVVGWEVVG